MLEKKDGTTDWWAIIIWGVLRLNLEPGSFLDPFF